MKQKTPSVCGKTTKEMELMIYKRYIVTKKKAADGNRTRVTHLGKVVRNHYATAANNNT